MAFKHISASTNTYNRYFQKLQYSQDFKFQGYTQVDNIQTLTWYKIQDRHDSTKLIYKQFVLSIIYLFLDLSSSIHCFNPKLITYDYIQ